MNVAKVWMLAVLLVPVAACAKKSEAPEAEPPAVRVAPVTKGAITEWVRLSGKVVPPRDHDATLSPRVEGVLAEVTVHVGERVMRGKVLARVDTAALEDALASAQAAEKSAAAEAEAKRSVATRTEKLLAHGIVSGEQTQTDEAAAVAAEAAFDEAKAARATAARKRTWATVVAPFDGVVVSVLRQAGDSVDGTPATPVIQLSAEHGLEVALDAPAADLARLQEGEAAEVLVAKPESADDPPAIPGRVSAVAAAIDPKTGTGPVRIDPTTDDPSLILGRVVEARIAVARHDDAVIVPSKALRGGAEGAEEVVVIEDHKAHVRTVTTGLRDGDRVEVTSGLAPGAVIVVDDPIGLADDAPVRDGP